MTLRAIATDMATSDAGQAFGFRSIPEDADLLTVGKIWAEFALRVSHWVPGVGTATGMLSLALLALRVSRKPDLDDEDRAECIRDILAITGAIYALILLDVGATYLRAQEEVSPHKQYNYLEK